MPWYFCSSFFVMELMAFPSEWRQTIYPLGVFLLRLHCRFLRLKHMLGKQLCHKTSVLFVIVVSVYS